jgi:hypothetical protein
LNLGEEQIEILPQILEFSGFGGGVIYSASLPG